MFIEQFSSNEKVKIYCQPFHVITMLCFRFAAFKMDKLLFFCVLLNLPFSGVG